MWPDMMGPGWGQQLMMTVGLLCAVIVVLKILEVVASNQETGTPDRFLLLWHRYEIGDLTRQEFERLRQSAHAHTQERRAQVDPGLGVVLPDESSIATS